MNGITHCETPLIVTTKVERERKKVLIYVSIIKSKLLNLKYYGFTHDNKTKVINKTFYYNIYIIVYSTRVENVFVKSSSKT